MDDGTVSTELQEKLYPGNSPPETKPPVNRESQDSVRYNWHKTQSDTTDTRLTQIQLTQDSLRCNWHNTVEPLVNGNSKIDKTKTLMTNGSLVKAKSIAEGSPWSILHYFWPALSDNWSWKLIFVSFWEWSSYTSFTVLSRISYIVWKVIQHDKSDINRVIAQPVP